MGKVTPGNHGNDLGEQAGLEEGRTRTGRTHRGHHERIWIPPTFRCPDINMMSQRMGDGGILTVSPDMEGEDLADRRTHRSLEDR